MLDQIRYNLAQNLARVENLVKTYETHPQAQGKGRKSAELLDILRAAVVLLHASLEDVLRSTAQWKLPNAPSETLDEIPLVGLGPNPKKFLLGDLATFRGKVVDEIFAASVAAYLEKSNYNNVGEIATVLNGMKVDVTKVSGTFPRLQELMERRHQIVHRADRQSSVIGSGDCVFRFMPATSSGACRAMIPVDVGPAFRSMPAGGCDAG
jgi:hypothetical protein